MLRLQLDLDFSTSDLGFDMDLNQFIVDINDIVDILPKNHSLKHMYYFKVALLCHFNQNVTLTLS